jgi:hypothetical protein
MQGLGRNASLSLLDERQTCAQQFARRNPVLDKVAYGLIGEPRRAAILEAAYGFEFGFRLTSIRAVNEAVGIQ